jgi:Ser/Thr protein kinase RdoA (MazF antagonist)
VISRWGVEGELRPLPGERDQNHVVDGRYVLKISRDDRALLEAQNRVLERLRPTGLVQEVVPALAGELIVPVGDGRLARLLSYLPGRPIADVSSASLRSVGQAIARIDAALEGCDEPAFRRDFHWDLEHAGEAVSDPRMLGLYAAEIAPRLDGLRRGLIHGDANEYNLLVGAGDRVTGVLDFGDMVWSRVVYDPAIAAAYAMRMAADPVAAVADVAAGYHELHPLTEDEQAVLYPLACLRLCHSVAVAAIQRRRDPHNAYLGASQGWIRRVLPRALAVDARLAHEAVRAGCATTSSTTRRR